ncbi:MAG: S41 family peptidase [Melioribacteraceae bacterium]|nr:S41 family peptidase [Melioribacteraceae bacterium]
MAADKRFSKILILIIGLLVGFQIGKWLTSSSISEFNKVESVLKLTQQYYIDEIDPDTLSETAIEGILSKLDPHSTYIPADIQEVIEEEFEGSFEGIGIEFQIIDDTITVISPIIGGPSEELGIQPGDKIIGIEDSSAVGFSNTDVVRMLRGEKGSEVKISIYRPSLDELFDFTITRDVIPINSVETSFIVQDSVGYVRLSRFAEKTTDELKSALSDLSNGGMKYLVLDLRNNSGGYLDQSVSISDLFIDGEKLIVFTDGRISEFDEEFKASVASQYEDIPLIILINRGSASASEIVSGAVQDWDRGLVIGETSFGKGLVQRSFLLSDNSAVRLTISEYSYSFGKSYSETIHG